MNEELFNRKVSELSKKFVALVTETKSETWHYVMTKQKFAAKVRKVRAAWNKLQDETNDLYLKYCCTPEEAANILPLTGDLVPGGHIGLWEAKDKSAIKAWHTWTDYVNQRYKKDNFTTKEHENV